MQRKTTENLEHNALRNQIAYIKKSGKGKHFVCGQEVLFSNHHQQGLVKIHNMKDTIVDALSGNYYHVTFTAENEQDSGQTQHSIALHASSLAPFLPTEKPEHEQTEKCREICVVAREYLLSQIFSVSHFTNQSRHDQHLQMAMLENC